MLFIIHKTCTKQFNSVNSVAGIYVLDPLLVGESSDFLMC